MEPIDFTPATATLRDLVASVTDDQLTAQAASLDTAVNELGG